MDESCPSIRLLRSLAESTGEDVDPPPELVEHVEGCASCRAILDRLARDGPGTGPSTVSGRPIDLDEVGPPPIPGLVDLRKIGSGGTSVVYRAKREGLDAWVAVKFLAAGPPGSRDHRERAVREAKAAACVRHPNVIRTFDVGLAGASPYIVMEYFKGGSLHDRLTGRPPLAPEPAARLALILAEAVAAIHAEGLVHRDLKPSNILLAGPTDAPPWDCTPIIADFGLAREYGGERLTDPRLAPGTPGYMAPEQIRGDRASIGPATDVFALGAILFRLLAGRPPFVGATRGEIVEQTLKDGAPPVSLFVPGVPPALAGITAACLRSRPHARYPSAAALADDLRRYLEDRPLAQRRSGRRLTRGFLATSVLLGTALMRGDADPSVHIPTTASPFETARDARDTMRPAVKLAELVAASSERMSLQELANVEGPLRDALNQVRAETSPGSAPDLRHDRAALAVGVALIDGRRGDRVAHAEMLAEAVRASEPPDGRWDGETRIKTAGFLLPLGRQLESLGLKADAVKAFERCREILEPIADSADARGLSLEAELMIASLLAQDGRGEQRWMLEAARSHIQLALVDHPGDARLLFLLGHACDLDDRPAGAVEAYRRRLEIPQFSEDEDSRVRLARALLKTAAPPDAIDAECRIRDGLDFLRWLRMVRGEDPDLRRRIRDWLLVAMRLDEEEARAEVDAASFGPRLAAALRAEGRDGCRLGATCDELAAEYAARTCPVTETGEPRSDLGGLSSEAARLFEVGLGLAERGDVTAARLKFAEALVTSAAPRRREGDGRRALRVCELARSLVVPMPSRPDDASNARRRLLAEAWKQTAKALFDHSERPPIREALSFSLQFAQAAFDADPDGWMPSPRFELDRALERLAVFEKEGGDYATAVRFMARREALWPEDSFEFRRARDACRAIEAERKARAGQGAVAAAR